MNRASLLAAILSLFCLNTQAQTSHNMTLLGNFHDPSLPSASGTRYNDVWGWTDCEQREYAILGSAKYVHFFNIENPASPQQVGFFTGGSTTVWRDMKTFRDRAYAVCDNCNEGLMIFDLSDMPSSVTKTNQTTQFFSSAHNIYIDENAGRLYVAGSNTKSNGVIILDLNADPDNPAQIGNPSLPGGYIHDIYVRNHIAYGSSGSNGLWVYNLSNPQNPVLLGTLTDYPQSGYNHSSWLSENGQHLVMADETHNKGIKMVDVSDLSDMTVTDVFRSALLAPADTASIAHNPFIRDEYVFISYYHDGVQVFDMSNPSNVVKVAWYDTYPGHTNYSGYKGCWGVYPFLSSGKILASDQTNGLFILSLNNITLDPIPHPTYPTPVITLNGGNPICQGQTVTISAHPSATDADWYLNGNLIQEGGLSIQVGQAGAYHAILYKEYCGIQSNSINLQVIPLPNPLITPLSDLTVCQGGIVTLSVDPTATNVQWYRNGILVQNGGFLYQTQQAGSYHAILFNQSCSIQTNTVQVQVIPFPSNILTLTGDNPICEGESVTLSVDASATSVEWYLNGALQPWQGTQIEATVTGSYYAKVYRQFCSVQTNLIFLQVIPLPDPEITPLGNPVICEGESIFLAVDPSSTNVIWYRNGEQYQTGGTLLQVNQAGTYSALLFHQFCSIESESIDIQVIPLPDPNIQLAGQHICEGESTLLFADPAATNVVWFLNGAPLPASGNPVEVQQPGWYHALIYNQNCTVLSDSANLQVIPLPNPLITPLGDPEICEGESVLISADPSATSVEWFLNGSSLPVEGFVIEAQEAGTYSAILYNQSCEIGSNAVQVEIIPLPDPAIAVSGGSPICEGETVTLSADPNASSIEWYLDGDLLPLTEAQIDVQEAGHYYAILSNQNCATQSDLVEIEVIAYPAAGISLSGDTSLCEGESVTLSADSSAANIHWYFNDELLPNENAAQLEAGEAGVYYAILSNQSCQTQSDAVEIEVFDVLDPEITFLAGSPAICEGGSALLAVDPNATIIEWYLDGQLLATQEPLIYTQTGGSYYAILSNPSCYIQTEPVEIEVIPYPSPEVTLSGLPTLCEGESLTLSADPTATAVQWFLDGQLLPWEETQIEVQTGGAYSAIVFNQFCQTQAETVEVQVIPAPSGELALSGETAICEGESALLSADPTATTIEWYLDGQLLEWTEAQIEVMTGGEYYAILSNEVCTTQTEAISIQAVPYPSPGIALSGEATLCEGESLTLSADPAATSVQWYLDGQPLPWEQTQIEVQEAGTYSAIAYIVFCATPTDSVELVVIPAPDPILTYETTLACLGDSILLGANGAMDSWQWHLDGAPIEPATGPQWWAGESGQYSYTGTLGPCEVASEPVAITIAEPVVPVLSYLNDTLFCTPAPSYQWYINDELLEGATGPFLVPEQSGAYSVWTTDENGCEALSNPIGVEIINSVSGALPAGWKIYPNPASDWLTLELPGAGQAKYALYDLTGRMLMNGSLQEEKTTLNLGDIENGLYILEIQSTTSKRQIKIFLIQ
jgi:choice-of-anchor B domain-containing protein